jgi:rare lipoprotein A
VLLRFRLAQLPWLMLLACAFLMFSDERAEAEKALASWYGPGLQGLPTASGEPFDANGYTAAHKTLPLGTELLVSHEGRSVSVRINDRGPYVGGRELDLSQAAARDLGLMQTGTDYVEYSYAGNHEPGPSQGATQGLNLSQRVPQEPGAQVGAGSTGFGYAGGNYEAAYPGYSDSYPTARNPANSKAVDLSQGVPQEPEPIQAGVGYAEPGYAGDGSYGAGYPTHSQSYPTARDEASGGTYIVQPGDSLSQIADWLGTSVDHLADSNGITDPNLIYSGQTLRFQAPEKNLAKVSEQRTTNSLVPQDPSKVGGNMLASGEAVADPASQHGELSFSEGAPIPGDAADHSEEDPAMVTDSQDRSFPASYGA